MDEPKKQVDIYSEDGLNSIYPQAKSYDERLEKRELLDGLREKAIYDMGREISIYEGFILNLHIVIPYVLSFISIVAIMSFGSIENVNASFGNRAAVILLAAPATLPWLYFLKVLTRSLGDYRMGRLELLLMYLAFAAPATYLAVHLDVLGINRVLILGAFAVVSQLYVWGLFGAFNKTSFVVARLIWPGAILAVVMSGAVFMSGLS